ncbi:MAG TPA: amino acid transporter [Streptosporangiales bacterium]
MTAVQDRTTGFRRWLLDGSERRATQEPGPHRQGAEEHRTHSWWRVMCLTGVDYFSTLGYQPGIAVLAAGVLSPLATLVLVLLTLVGALPVYRRVARESPHGEGSIAMLERLLSWWTGKIFVLVLLGFVATDFMITITLSAADASAHLVENPFATHLLHGHNVIVTLVLIAALGVVFLRGFSEAIGVAVTLVGAYLALNVVVIAVGLVRVLSHPVAVGDWTHAVSISHGNPVLTVAVVLLVFPKLALGLSGFETGVAVMPQITGAKGDTRDRPAGRVRGARKLLTTAAVTMSVLLVTSSFATTVLIPERAFQPGGPASGRALAYLAHTTMGDAFGTVYDVSTIAILWFAGASAMAGLLNIVPRYLPRYGMAPGWARAVRPLVLIFVAVAFVITLIFKADVDAQGGAYATGVLVLITSATVAVTLSAYRARQRGLAVGFGVVTLVFAYTTVTNVVERPEGVQIASIFIAAILVVSFASRVSRSFELRATDVRFDPAAERVVDHEGNGVIRVIANEPDARDAREYAEKEAEQRDKHNIPPGDPVIFLEVTVSDPSEFEHDLEVTGEVRHGYYILTVRSAAIPSAIAAILLHLRDAEGKVPHAYFAWTEGNPIAHLLRYIVFGEGEVAPVTREILRRAEPDLDRRPVVHVG